MGNAYIMVRQLDMIATTKIRQLIGVALLGVFAVAMLGCSGIIESAQWRTFNSTPISQFSLEYPSGWRSDRFLHGYKSDPELVALFYIPAPQLFPGVKIARRTVPSPTLDDAAEWGLERFEALNSDMSDEFEIFPLEDIIVNGAEAMSREFIMDTETLLPLKRKDVYIARGEDMLVITLISTLNGYEDALPLFDHMINSFESLEE